MATSSITKNFIAKDERAYQKMVEEISAKPERTVKTDKSSGIERGHRLLKRFSFR